MYYVLFNIYNIYLLMVHYLLCIIYNIYSLMMHCARSRKLSELVSSHH